MAVRRTSPVRTCVGCRKRASSSELLRFVAVESSPGQFKAEPDPARRRLGRGAHLHPDPACLALAERRRAFGRALRITGVVDAGPLAEVIAMGSAHDDGVGASAVIGTADGGRATPHPDTQGRNDGHEHTMKHLR